VAWLTVMPQCDQHVAISRQIVQPRLDTGWAARSTPRPCLGMGTSMKKIYHKPTLDKHQQLSRITAAAVSSQNNPKP